MKKTILNTYSKAGVMKKSGEGLLLELPGDRYYLTAPDIMILVSDQPAGIINSTGDEEGCAWLSPLREARKLDFVASLHGHIYVIRWREVQRLLSGKAHLASVLEYHMPERDEGWSSGPVSVK
jgi:hypothetical protein